MYVYFFNVVGTQSRFPTSTKASFNKNVSCECSEIIWKLSNKRSKMKSFLTGLLSRIFALLKKITLYNSQGMLGKTTVLKVSGNS